MKTNGIDLEELTRAAHSIAYAYPEVSAELADQSLSSAFYDSDDVVDWLCPHCGETWSCSISDRTIRRVKHDCVDLDEALTDESDSLASRAPELMDRWDAAANGVQASEVPVTSKKTWAWRCPQHGETWKMAIREARRAQPCEKCRIEKIKESMRAWRAAMPIKRSALDDPLLKDHWIKDKNEIDPKRVSATDKTYRRWFSCSDCRESTHKTPKAYTTSPRCRKCAKKRRDQAAGHGVMAAAVKKHGRTLADMKLFDPSVWADCNEYDLEEVGENSNVPIDFQCVTCDHEWTECLRDFLRDPHCPACYHDHATGAVQTVFPSFAEAPGHGPAAKDYASMPGVAEQLKLFHEKNYSYRLRAVNSIASRWPDVVPWFDKAKNGVSAGKVGYSIRSVDFWWTCPTCHESFRCSPYEIRKVIGGRKTTAHVCCDGRTAVRGVNTLDVLFPEVAAEWTPPRRRQKLRPKFVTPADDAPVWWECSCCHVQWSASTRERTMWSIYRKKCPVCNPSQWSKLDTGRTDLATVKPELLSRLSPANGDLVDPSKIYSDAINVRLLWRCDSHGDYRMTPDSEAKRGCLDCALERRRLTRLDKITAKKNSTPDETDNDAVNSSSDSEAMSETSLSAAATEPAAHKPHGGTANRPVTSSREEDELAEFIISVRPDLEEEINAHRNDRSVLAGREIDILVPSLKMGFEFDGTFFHNELHVGRLRAMDKWRDAASAEVDLIHVWEDDWTGIADADRLDRLKNTVAAMLRGDAEAVLREVERAAGSTSPADVDSRSAQPELTVENGSPEWWACRQLGWQLLRVDGPRAWALRTTGSAGLMLRSHVCSQHEVATSDPAYIAWDTGVSTWKRP